RLVNIPPTSDACERLRKAKIVIFELGQTIREFRIARENATAGRPAPVRVTPPRALEGATRPAPVVDEYENDDFGLPQAFAKVGG
ncbi:globin-coupled sensor protein, partial [Rhizobium leguminosarum]